MPHSANCLPIQVRRFQARIPSQIQDFNLRLSQRCIRQGVCFKVVVCKDDVPKPFACYHSAGKHIQLRRRQIYGLQLTTLLDGNGQFA